MAQQWQELKGEHFIVYFTQDEKFAKDVSYKAEVYYRDIATALGYPRYSDFWTWDKRVKIYIYPDRPSFLKATAQPDWSHGMADYGKKQILSYAWGEGFLESLLPHEMAHLIFRDFVGFKGEVPLWLDEGVAQWAEEPKRRYNKLAMRQLYDKDALLSLDDMMKLDIRQIKDTGSTYTRPMLSKTGKKATLVVSAGNLVDIYYTQAISLVGFLIDKYGSDSFAVFCRQLRDGNTLEDALRAAYPTNIRSIAELETTWRRYLTEN